jgi:hypothetical protein
MARVAFVLAVAQLLAVATFEVGVTGRSGARGRSRAQLLLLPAARSRRANGGAPIFESFEAARLTVAVRGVRVVLKVARKAG